jgi:signal-transduction protein with cAMP-binding, CBS, and nucleotidyltransferase domain
MTETVRDVMTKKPVALEHTATVVDAARAMRDGNFGTVIVVKDGKVCGVVTDRDIVIRAVAASHDPRLATLGEICSEDVMSVEANEPLAKVVMLMREKAIRRVPVVEDGRPVGVISLGDLAKKNDEGSTLTEISAAKPNQ